MLIEKVLEEALVSELKELDAMKDVEVVGSRIPSAIGIVKGEQDKSAKAVIAVAVGFRTHDNFSLSPISVSASIAITTRAEMDATGSLHEELLDAIAQKLSYWHKNGKAMQEALSSEGFYAGELRMDGGSGKQYDSVRATWVESVTFTIRGSEILKD